MQSTTGPRPDTASGSGPPSRTRPSGSREWRSHGGLLALSAVLGLFIAVFVVGWLTFDPRHTPTPVDRDFRPQYLLLVAHVLCGTVAMVTLVIQLWPWLRRRWPAVHRWSGRLYVFAGMTPSAVLSLVMLPHINGAVTSRVGAAVWAVLALATTLAGYRTARLGRWAAHRRWMLYSFALAATPVTGRLLVLVVPAVGEGTVFFVQTEIEAFWLAWALNLALVHRWLGRGGRRAHPEPA